jgi:MFS family permease
MKAVPAAPGDQSNQQLAGAFKTFRALRHRDFRLLWIGLAVSAVGTWMQIVAGSLLVLKITHGSAFALGTVSLAQALAFFLFALVGGSVADRIDKRRLLLVTQTASAALAVLLGFLTLFGVIQLWMMLVLAFLNGTLLSFDQPARSALVPVLVRKEDLGNAISLQSRCDARTCSGWIWRGYTRLCRQLLPEWRQLPGGIGCSVCHARAS